jgi:hypothetical protein
MNTTLYAVDGRFSVTAHANITQLGSVKSSGMPKREFVRSVLQLLVTANWSQSR